jgi:hypothetical protein
MSDVWKVCVLDIYILYLPVAQSSTIIYLLGIAEQLPHHK